MTGRTNPRLLRRLVIGAVSALALLAPLGVAQAASADAPSATSGSVRSGDVSAQTHVRGIDVSHWQGYINWSAVRNDGIQFAFIKATEGTSYTDPRFDYNYPRAYYAGVIRGAYHFARPNYSSGYRQANFFVNNGGAWSADHRTLPGALDLEAPPSGSYCYGKTDAQMRYWIKDFYDRYKYRTGRDVVIYTTAYWWNRCTGYWTGMWWRSPLWVAHWNTSSPRLPYGWRQNSTWTFWQYTNCRSVSGISGCVDGNYFNGSRSRLIYFADH